jgi:hypothetical protein
MKLVKEYLAEIHSELVYEFLSDKEVESNEYSSTTSDNYESDDNLFCINSYAIDCDSDEDQDFANTEVLFYSETEDSIKVKVRQLTKHNEYSSSWEWHDIAKV